MSRYAIAVDLGGTQVRAALVDDAGQILKSRAVLTKAQEGPRVVLAQIAELVQTVIADAGDHTILGVGLSCPGPLDTERGVALSLPTLSGFDSYPVLARLRALLPYPVQLENDAIAAAIGEWKFGAGRGLSNLVYVTVSTGIGGGVIVDGRVVRGRRGMACHLGHMSIMLDGALCNCGSRGCIEAYGAGPAFTARAILRAEGRDDSLLGKNGGLIDSPAVFAAAKRGDVLALELVAEEAEILGGGFASYAHLFSPDMIVMGGGLSNEFEMLRPGIETKFAQVAMVAFKDVRIVRAALGGNSGLIGAASLVFDRAT